MKLVFLCVVSLTLGACVFSDSEKLQTSHGAVYVPKCSRTINYDGHTLGIKGVEIPIPALGTAPVKVGEVTWDAKVLQTAANVTQALEEQRLQSCGMLKTVASMSEAKFEEQLDRMNRAQAERDQLVLLILANNPDAVKKWIEENPVGGRRTRALRPAELKPLSHYFAK